jgi:hypothetical protein
MPRSLAAVLLAVFLTTTGAEKPAPPAVPIAPPVNLTYTNDPSVCTKHTGLAGALICPPLLTAATSVVLVWDWPNCGTKDCTSVVDGYRVYQVTQGAIVGNMARMATRKLVGTQTNADETIKAIAPFTKTDCYVVTAYKGSEESKDSNTFCMTPNLGMGVSTQNLHATIWQTRSAYNVPCAHPDTGDNVTITYGAGQGTVGRQGFTSGSCSGDLLFESLFAFNFLPGQFHIPVKKAVLTVHITNPSCFKQIGLFVKQNWADANSHNLVQLLTLEPAGIVPLSLNGTTGNADVTALLNQGNFPANDTGQGVTLNGHPAPQGDPGVLWEFGATGATAGWQQTEPSCESVISNVQLAVTAYNQ